MSADTNTTTDSAVSVKKPPLYKVIIHNDDFSSFELVVGLLMGIFDHTESVSEQKAWQVHNEGKTVAGVYTREIAETKIAQSNHIIEKNEMPLQLTMEPE